MKKFIGYILVFVSASTAAHAQCFSPVSGGRLFQTMEIYVSHASLHGHNLQPGDEIGVFDGELCVGVGVLTEELTEESDYLLIEVARRFLWWDGFTTGHPILYRFCSGGELVHTTIVPTYISNGPTFDPNSSCIVELRTINSAPTVTSVPVTEAQPGLAYSYTITADDTDGDSLSYIAIILPGWLDFNYLTHTLSATPGEDDVGDQHVTIRVSDGDLHVDHTFIVTVQEGNHAPTISSNPPTSVSPGESYEYTICAQDVDNDSLSYTAPVLPDWLTFDSETKVLSGVPLSSNLGWHDITLRVCDGTVSADQSFPVNVERANTPPSFFSTPVTVVLAGDHYVYYAEAMDVDGDDLDYSALILPDWLTFDSATQTLHGTPGYDDAGDHNVSLRVTDGEGSEDQNFVISVDFAIGVEDLSSKEGIFIYPNPTEGRFRLELSRESEEEIILEILDPVGKVLLMRAYPPYHLLEEDFDLSNRCAGMHFVRVFNDSFSDTRKLIIY